MAHYTIGELARRSGLTVKTIRFYSDSGLLPPSGRTRAGHRRYSDSDLARLELVRSLRESGFDLAAIGGILDRRVGLREAVALQLEAVELQLRSLRLRQVVLRTALARGHGSSGAGDGAGYLGRLQALARLGAAERERLVNGFVDRISDGIPIDQEWLGKLRRASVPELPEEPTAEQLDAWLEFAELLGDEDFQQRLRALAPDSSRAPATTWRTR